MKIIAAYVRVSTTDKGQDLEVQILPLKEYIEKSWWVLYKIYSDKVSGSKESRPWLDQMLSDAKQWLFDTVIVYRFDRLSRSVRQLITTLELFRKLKIDFVSINEAIDTSTSMGMVMFTIIGAFAQFERAVISERVRSWLALAVKSGKILGRKPLVIDIELVRELRQQGLSIRAIAQKTWYSKWKIFRVLSQNTL